MLKHCIIVLLLLTSYNVRAQENVDSILRMIHDKDQQVRMNIIRCQQSQHIDSLIYYVERMTEIDAENQQNVARLLDSNGIPEGLSKKAYDAIFLVVDHADLDFQKRYYKLLRDATKDGRYSLSQINTLYDRMMMHSGRRQLYGTQTQSATKIVEGEDYARQVNYVWPVRRANGVDKRRLKSGQSSMQEQSKAHEKMGYKVVWNKSLSVKKFQKMIEEMRE